MGKQFYKQMEEIMLQPTFDHILVQLIDSDNVTAGGIILTDNSTTSRTQKGTVLAIGPGTYQDGHLIPVRLRVNSTVHFMRNSGIKLPDTKEHSDLFMLREGDVFGVE